MINLKYFIIITLLNLASSVSVFSQKPFYTDDSDVTEKGNFHFEFSNRFDRLQKSVYPTKRQNAASFLLAYGLPGRVEISIETPIITLFGDRAGGFSPGRVTGVGDTNFGVKYNIRQERDNSRMPALSISASIEIPTGETRKQIGSGIADFGGNFIAQKTFGEKNVFRANAGVIFAGNRQDGALGIKVRGTVLTGGASFTRDFTGKLKLGVEVTGAAASNFRLSKGQLQFQFGGNYLIRENMTLDFGVLGGRFAASPRAGAQIGVSIDF